MCAINVYLFKGNTKLTRTSNNTFSEIALSNLMQQHLNVMLFLNLWHTHTYISCEWYIADII